MDQRKLAKPQRWQKTNDGYVLGQDHCYLGTVVSVHKGAGGRWVFLITVVDVTVQENESTRSPGSVTSTGSWIDDGGAKQNALLCCRNQRWLAAAGITFK